MAEFDLTYEITRVLKDYTGSVMDSVDKAVVKCGNGLKKDLSAGSPRRTGDYAANWRCQFSGSVRGNKSATVHNKTVRRNPRGIELALSSLLENGHRKRRKTVKKGKVPPVPHIAQPAEKWTHNFEQMCEDACIWG